MMSSAVARASRRFGIATRDTFLREELVGRADPIHFMVSIARDSGENPWSG